MTLCRSLKTSLPQFPHCLTLEPCHYQKVIEKTKFNHNRWSTLKSQAWLSKVEDYCKTNQSEPALKAAFLWNSIKSFRMVKSLRKYFIERKGGSEKWMVFPRTPGPVNWCPSPQACCSSTAALLLLLKKERPVKFYLKEIYNSQKAKLISSLSKWFPDCNHIN